MMAAATVDLPAIGKVKKEYVYAIGAGTVAFVAWRWVQYSRGGGGEEVVLEEPVGLIENTPGFMSTGPAGLYGEDQDGPRPGSFVTNAEWAQYVVDQLDRSGINREAALAAIGKFLDRRPLNLSEQQYVRSALAVGGEPPQDRPWVIVPEVQGGTAPGVASVPGAVSGLMTSTSRTEARIIFSPPTVNPTAVARATATVYAGAAGGGRTRKWSRTFPGPLRKIDVRTGGILLPNRPYDVDVVAYNSAGKAGPVARRHIRTRR